MRLIKISALISYLVMVVVNALANALPINNIPTGAVSDSYHNLFTPSGLTFSIWGLIYLLLGLFVLYQLDVFGKTKKNKDLLEKVGIYFVISSLINASWIFAWHYDLILLSVALMLGLLYCLIKINVLLMKKLSTKEQFLVKLPFSIYFGWITVATIANITVFLVSVKWNGFGISESVWTILVLLIGATIGILTTLKLKNVAYASVLVWAYLGILLKHVSSLTAGGYASHFTWIINTTITCVILFVLTILYLIYKKYKHHSKK